MRSRRAPPGTGPGGLRGVLIRAGEAAGQPDRRRQARGSKPGLGSEAAGGGGAESGVRTTLPVGPGGLTSPTGSWARGSQAARSSGGHRAGAVGGHQPRCPRGAGRGPSERRLCGRAVPEAPLQWAPHWVREQHRFQASRHRNGPGRDTRGPRSSHPRRAVGPGRATGRGGRAAAREPGAARRGRHLTAKQGGRPGVRGELGAERELRRAGPRPRHGTAGDVRSALGVLERPGGRGAGFLPVWGYAEDF